MKHLLSIFPLVALLASCSSSSGPITNVTLSTGTMDGQMFLKDRQCNILPSDGISVTFIGTSLKALTDTNGFWSVSGIPAGYYDITFSKPGFATAKWFDIEFAGADTLHFLTGYDYNTL